MRHIKKLAPVFLCLIFLISTFCPAASAIEVSPRASLYLDSYGATLYAGTTKGSIVVEFTVAGTRISDYVGVSQLVIYNSNGSRAATITGTVANGLLREDAMLLMSEYTYYGQPGATYYAILTMYAERDGGSDSRSYTTNTVTAP